MVIYKNRQRSRKNEKAALKNVWKKCKRYLSK